MPQVPQAPFAHLLKPAPTPGANLPPKGNPQIAAAQSQLAAHGFSPGSTNGHLDIPTRRAVAQFQAANGIPATPSGTIDSATATALLRSRPSKPGTRTPGTARGITSKRAPTEAGGAAGAPGTVPAIVHSNIAQVGHAVTTRVPPGVVHSTLLRPVSTLARPIPTAPHPIAVMPQIPRPAPVASPARPTFGAGNPAPTSSRAPGTARTAINRANGGNPPAALSAGTPAPFSKPGGSTMSSAAGKHPGYWKATGLRVPLIMAAAIAAGATVLITQLPQMDFRGENVVIDPTIIGPNCLVTVPTVGTNPQVAGGPAGTGIPGTMFSPNQCGALDFAMQISNQGNALSMSVTNTLTNATLNFAALIFGHEVGPDTTAQAAMGGVAPAGAFLG